MWVWKRKLSKKFLQNNCTNIISLLNFNQFWNFKKFEGPISKGWKNIGKMYKFWKFKMTNLQI